jgi:hypothetical protein
MKTSSTRRSFEVIDSTPPRAENNLLSLTLSPQAKRPTHWLRRRLDCDRKYAWLDRFLSADAPRPTTPPGKNAPHSKAPKTLSP